ncbi:MAG: GtrA family protein [Oscillospiraceae bacterium]|nr:GtrA family protein [Oscillospiraceae bacterium]
MKNKQLFIQFLKFGIVGLSNTLVYLAVYYLLLFIVDYRIAYLIGFFVSVINAYIWSVKFVFAKAKQEPKGLTLAKPKSTAGRVVKVYISYGLTTAAGFLFMSVILVETFGMSDKIAPVLNLCLTIPLNFILNKFWAFK